MGRFIADFVDFGRKLVIEVDGGGHGGEADMTRDAWLRGEGFAVMRFWNSEVDGNLDGVMQGILDALEVEPPRRSGEGEVLHMKRLIQKGLMFGNLIEVASPQLVERYNRALKALTGKETGLGIFILRFWMIRRDW